MNTRGIVKKVSELLIAMVMVISFSSMAHANLTVVGTGTINGGTTPYQLIYDSGLNVSWLDYTAPATNWQNQVNWAQNLTVNFNGQNITGWRLPTTVDGPFFQYGYDGTTTGGYNITKPGDEMSYLYYVDLGNKGYLDTSGNIQPGYGLHNSDPFQNLLPHIYPYDYWYGTEIFSSPGNAWVFDFVSGGQTMGLEINNGSALAVLPGNAADYATPTPIPAAAYLFGSGLLGLIGLRKKLLC